MIENLYEMEIISKQEEKEECIICLDEVEQEWKELECHHRYHKKCINTWITINNQCPVCKRHIHESGLEIAHCISITSSIQQEQPQASSEQNSIINSAIRRFVMFIMTVIVIIIITVLCSPRN